MRLIRDKFLRLVLLTWILISVILYYYVLKLRPDVPPHFVTLSRHHADDRGAQRVWNDSNASRIYPSVQHFSDDRIERQLRFVAEAVRRKRGKGEAVSVKKILIVGRVSSWNVKEGSTVFEKDRCSVSACEITYDVSQSPEADVVVSKGDVLPFSQPSWQVRVLYALESPLHTFSRPTSVNWTATYRHDSTLVAPYEKFVPLNSSLLTRDTAAKNYAQGKTKKVAWFVSNCYTCNSRMSYAQQLAKFIQVDIYGGCGTLVCPRNDERCSSMLNEDYKFYLAFENSNCRDYITEKFFITGLKHDVIPIAMGAAPEDYHRAAPPHSFIHVDDFRSPKELAAYLHQLDQDDALYNQYFAWKGLWNNINTYFWCRLCALAHDVERRGPSWYEDFHNWWDGPGVCITEGSWNNVDRPELIADLAIEVNSP